jgi:hypothetical protein
MPKLSEEEVERQHVMLYKADMDYIRKEFGDTIGISKAIRTIIRQYVKRLREAVEERLHD